MSLTTSIFYLQRAAECARDAEAAGLANVRERFREAERVWLGLAHRAELAETGRNARGV